MDSRQRRAALWRNLAPRMRRWIDEGGDEIDVLEVMQSRLERGHAEYGALDVRDGRDWRIQRAEELVDAEMYGAFEIVRARRERVEAIEARPDDDDVIELQVADAVEVVSAIDEDQNG